MLEPAISRPSSQRSTNTCVTRYKGLDLNFTYTLPVLSKNEAASYMYLYVHLLACTSLQLEIHSQND